MIFNRAPIEIVEKELLELEALAVGLLCRRKGDAASNEGSGRWLVVVEEEEGKNVAVSRIWRKMCFRFSA